jgi:hypothetical protein
MHARVSKFVVRLDIQGDQIGYGTSVIRTESESMPETFVERSGGLSETMTHCTLCTLCTLCRHGSVRYGHYVGPVCH